MLTFSSSLSGHFTAPTPCPCQVGALPSCILLTASAVPGSSCRQVPRPVSIWGSSSQPLWVCQGLPSLGTGPPGPRLFETGVGCLLCAPLGQGQRVAVCSLASVLILALAEVAVV